ncbi:MULTISPECIES: ATP-binding protein [unclassified Duganella]|uniref:ATP-binding protein n=1 Tax=unclassified Duganella TaxID=2636909 RepID=UPI000887DA25|nr:MULTISPECIES: ATP-binding protein [unclassified Duganella]SDF93637.1 His Kinase A (phospho-acceptor) domain-containing protein [Duganella sp. OV458]SDJ11179.1 His Kinase A (phospho-acceptor) domain-containing protein [Duganella sp. OV510]
MSAPTLPRYLSFPAFIALYVLFDWATYIDPLYGLNITPWNPDPALGLVLWLLHGWRAALPWYVALVLGEWVVRGMPAGLPLTLLLSLWLVCGYGMLGAVLRRKFGKGGVFDSRSRLFEWVLIVVAGTLLNDVVYMSLLSLAGLIPSGEWLAVVLRFGIGDIVGVLVSMPLVWMLSSAQGRSRLRSTVWRYETLGYLALAICVLTFVFGTIATSEFKHFYFLFMPVIWAASRQGLYGTALMVFVLQLGIGALVKWNNAVNIEVAQLQMLDAMLALVGFSLGIVVDELRQVSNDLKQSLRLAAAGEMAAALAHELNQPLTALGAYGKACEFLIERGEAGQGGEMLKNAVQRMIAESGRAAEVVRRLRDFFRTGAMKLEPVEAGQLVSSVSQQFFTQLRQHGVVLQVEEMPPLAMLADRLQIELVLRNLLANALDAVQEQPEGQRRITVSLQQLDSKKHGKGSCVQLTVEDSGKGVSEALLARLFEPFVSSKASGLGLGLVLSRSIMEAHGGSLWAEVGDHGIFRMALPLARDTVEEQENYAA